MSPYAYIGLAITLVLACCKPPESQVNVIHVPVEGIYSLNLPDFLRPGYDMHDYASLQYYDSEREFYVLGIEDAKQNLGEIKRKRLKLNGYFNFVEKTVMEKADSSLMESLEIYQLTDSLMLRSADYYVRLQRWPEPVEVYYRIAVLESSEYFFQLVIWMPYDVHCNYMPWTDTITHSFRLIADPP